MSWTSILLFVKKYWKVIAGAALAVVLWLVLTTLYDRIWQQGYDAKTAEIDALTVERNEQVAVGEDGEGAVVLHHMVHRHERLLLAVQPKPLLLHPLHLG